MILSIILLDDCDSNKRKATDEDEGTAKRIKTDNLKGNSTTQSHVKTSMLPYLTLSLTYYYVATGFKLN